MIDPSTTWPVRSTGAMAVASASTVDTVGVAG